MTAVMPAEGAAPPPPLPLFPADNGWNTNITAAPVDPDSASYVAFINNGGTRRLHPDFGGEAAPGGVDVYGMPYAIVDGSQAKQPVTFTTASTKRNTSVLLSASYGGVTKSASMTVKRR